MLDGCKKTPLYETHLKLNGRMVDFGGWALPVQYSSILEEHRAVRENCGLFDVSHMGEVFVRGSGALDYLQNIMTNDFTNMLPGRCRYSMMCYENGGCVDDVLVYKQQDGDYLVVMNAANTDKDFEWMLVHAKGYDVTLTNSSPHIALLALQGPLAEEILAPLCDRELPKKNYTFVPHMFVVGVGCLVSRTGYTGEDGFELYCAAADAAALHAALMEAGKDKGLLPCGLGARDTLRFEAGMPLYGHELSKDITPLECGLSFAVKLNKPDFIGKAALMHPPARVRVGLKLIDRGVAREHCEVQDGGETVGITTSGSPAPTVGGNCAMALVTVEAAKKEQLSIIVRGRALAAQVVALPFYKRTK